MKNLLHILPLIYSLSCFAQRETKEDFVNDVYRTFVDSRHIGYYLNEKPESMYDQIGYSTTRQDDDSSGIIPPNVAMEMIGKIKRDKKRKPAKWNFATLVNAKRFNKDSSGILNIAAGTYVLDTNKKREKLNEDLYRRWRENYGGVYSLSEPVFDNAHQYAMLYVDFYCGSLCASGFIYYYHKTGNKWIFLAKTLVWIS